MNGARGYRFSSTSFELVILPARHAAGAAGERLLPGSAALLLADVAHANMPVLVRLYEHELHGRTHRPLTAEDGRRMIAHVRDALEHGHLVALRIVRRRIIMQIERAVLGPVEDAIGTGYELLLEIKCEVTKLALPRAHLAVFDDKDRQVWSGQADVQGKARVDVGVPGQYRVVVFQPIAERPRLLVVGDDGNPLPRTKVDVEDSEGAKQSVVTNDHGVARLDDAASGVAKVTVGKDTAKVYLHPRHSEPHVARMPGALAAAPFDPYAHEIAPEGESDPPAASPPPAPPAPAAAAPPANAATPPPSDPDIDKLNLAPEADAAARALKKKNPGVVFTSGRRSVKDQVHAMAVNVAAEIAKSGKRDWIHVTYVEDSAHNKLQKWVDDHTEATTTDAIAKGLEDTVDGMTEAEKMSLSKHITGRAFDIQPGSAKEEDVKALPGLKQFLKKEGNLVRWHCQF